MSETEIFKKLSDAVDTGNVEMAKEAANEAIAKGVPALKAILNGLAGICFLTLSNSGNHASRLS